MLILHLDLTNKKLESNYLDIYSQISILTHMPPQFIWVALIIPPMLVGVNFLTMIVLKDVFPFAELFPQCRLENSEGTSSITWYFTVCLGACINIYFLVCKTISSFTPSHSLCSLFQLFPSIIAKLSPLFSWEDDGQSTATTLMLPLSRPRSYHENWGMRQNYEWRYH